MLRQTRQAERRERERRPYELVRNRHLVSRVDLPQVGRRLRYDKRQADFHEIYRLRPKIEAYFSLVKRVSSGFCWSRGRKRKDADGVVVGNRREPCTAWKNETLCKVIYVNLRQIVRYEFETGYRMNLTADTLFRALPEGNTLIA